MSREIKRRIPIVKLKNISEEMCSHCGFGYKAKHSKDTCSTCGTTQLSCAACSNHTNCFDCKDGNRFIEHENPLKT